MCAGAAGRRHNPRGVWDEGLEGEISPKGRATQGLLMRHDALRRENRRLRALDLKPGVRGRVSQGRICLLQPKADRAGEPAGGATQQGQRRTWRPAASPQMVHDWRSGMAEALVGSIFWFSWYWSSLQGRFPACHCGVAERGDGDAGGVGFLSMRGFQTSRLP